MRKNIHKTAKTIAYITATTLIAATLFACGSKDDDVSKIKDAVEHNSVSEDTKSLEEIFGIVFGDDDSDDNDSKNDNDTNTEQETETSIVTEIDDNGEEVTKVVSVIQTEDGTKKVVDNNNSSTQKPNSGNSNNSGNNGSNSSSNGSSGNNTSSGGNGNNGNSGASGNSGNSSNGTVNNKPVTPSGGNSGNGNNGGNTGNSGNTGTTPTTATEDGGNGGGNISSGGYTCTGQLYNGDNNYEYYIVEDGLKPIYHLNVTMLCENIASDNDAFTKWLNENGYLNDGFINTKLLNVPCMEFQYYEWLVCNDCGEIQILLKKKNPTANHSYVEKMVMPATYRNQGRIDFVCTVCGISEISRYTDKLNWYAKFAVDDVSLDGIYIWDDDGIQKYDSGKDGYVNDSWNTEYEYNDTSYYFRYIYQVDSNRNPIREKCILAYDANGNPIYSDRPYWIREHGWGCPTIYATMADIRNDNPLYDWSNRTEDGTLIE